MLLLLHVPNSQVGIFIVNKFPSQSSFINKKLEIEKTKTTFSYQYSKLYTRWSHIPTFLLLKLLREGNQIWFTCNSATFGNIWVLGYTKKFFQEGKGRWSFWYVKKFYVFWRTNLDDPTVFKQPGQYVHFTLWKCHFCYLGFKTGIKQSPLKNFLCWKKIFRMEFLNSYDIRKSLRP